MSEIIRRWLDKGLLVRLYDERLVMHGGASGDIDEVTFANWIRNNTSKK